MYDILVIGGGPAGISAAIYAVSRGRKTLILEQKEIGGVIGKVSTVTHYAGILEQETGATFAGRLKQQALSAGVEIVYEAVTGVSLTGEQKEVQTARGSYRAQKVILTNGTTPRKLGIEGETALSGKGVESNAAKDGPKYQGRSIYVVGGADGAVKEALYLSQFASELTIVHFEETLGCIAEFRNKVAQTPNMKVRTGTRLNAVYGTQQVEALDLVREQDGGVEHVKDPGCGIFIYAGATPNTQLYTQLELEDGYIPVDGNMETAVPGVYAAGDIRVKQVRQVATAVSDGAIAGIHAAAHIR